ncbi:MAG TPA: AAA family ATPase [Caulobacterales bacterium]|nr:AAA family ATPase [Caulobacterales bacterium]
MLPANDASAEEAPRDLFDAEADRAECVIAEQDAKQPPANEHEAPASTPAPPVPAPAEIEDDEPPFDPPDEDDDIFGKTRLPRSDAEMSEEEAADRAAGRPIRFAAPEPSRPSDLPVPPISIAAFWDRPEVAQLFSDLSAHRLMARANIRIERGGLDGAAVRLAQRETPDLIIVDTTLRGAEMLRGLETLGPAIGAGAKVLVVGAVNDIGLLRELAQRGVSHYLVTPVQAEDLVRTVSSFYAEYDNARVIAVIGARGGVGASSLAQNLAWSIAERHGVNAALMDLDLAFGTAAFHLQEQTPYTVADLLLAPNDADDAFVERVTARQTERLRLLSAPASLDRALDVDAAAIEQIIGRVRRTASFVVLDLPHRWTSWMKQTLAAADDVFIVAEPDLTNLRNTKNMLDVLTPLRTKASPPSVVLSMVGMPKRPEIPVKEFAEAIGAEPVATLGFDPDAFGLAVAKAKALGEVAAQSKAASAVDALATALTGRAPIEPRKPDAYSFAATHAAPTVEPISLPHIAASAEQEVPMPYSAETEPDAPPAAPATLELVSPATAEQEYLERARTAALADLHAHLKGKRGQKIRGNGRIRRAAAAIVAIFLVGGLWRNNEPSQAAAMPAPAVERIVARPAQPRADLAPRYDAAISMMRSGKVLEGVVALRAVAEDGFPLAQYRLAKLYELGEGLPSDLPQARQWTERAAAAGNIRAMHDLGVYLARGDGGVRDEMSAFRWFKLAAERGVADSQYNLAVLYAQGRGVSADLSEALTWFLIAARSADETAMRQAQALEARLTPAQVQQAQSRANAFTPAAINTYANETAPRDASNADATSG